MDSEHHDWLPQRDLDKIHKEIMESKGDASVDKFAIGMNQDGNSVVEPKKMDIDMVRWKSLFSGCTLEIPI